MMVRNQQQISGEFSVLIMKKIDNQIIYKIVNNYYEQIPNNKYEQEDYNLVVNSKAYDKFAQVSDSLKLALEERKKYNHNYRENEDITAVFLDSIFRSAANINFLKKYYRYFIKIDRTNRRKRSVK